MSPQQRLDALTRALLGLAGEWATAAAEKRGTGSVYLDGAADAQDTCVEGLRAVLHGPLVLTAEAEVSG